MTELPQPNNLYLVTNVGRVGGAFSATETRLEVSVHTPSFVAVLNAKQLADRCAFEHSENCQTVNACELRM
jgi:hypothetical protein